VNLAPIGYVRCPACSGEVAPAPCALCCIQCRRSFPVDNGIPVLLDRDTAVMWANIAALDAETARYTFVLTAIALVARVWLPAGGAVGLTVSEEGYEGAASTRYNTIGPLE
jgi:uncharacterized protein YbaR (Trm112 family)